MFTKQFVQAQNLATDAGDFIVDKAQSEQGEIASWMIVLGALVAAAVAAKTEVGGAIETLVTTTAGKIT